MAPETGYTFNWNSVQRIADVVSEYESRAIDGTVEAKPVELLPGVTAWCKVGAAVPGSAFGLHDARVVYQEGSHDWLGSDACYVFEVNGAPLAAGDRLLGKQSSWSVGGLSVFGVQASGGSDGGTGSATALIITSKDAGTAFYNASACSHDGAAWQCGAAGNLPIDLLAIDMNGLELDIGRRYIGVHVGTKDGKKIYGIQTWWNVVTNVHCDDTGLHQTKREI